MAPPKQANPADESPPSTGTLTDLLSEDGDEEFVAETAARVRSATSAPGGTVTLLFTDIVDSTKILQSLGATEAEKNRVWLERLLNPHAEIVRDCLHAHEGFEVTTTGDGFFLTFADPANAVLCAVEIQQRLARVNLVTPVAGNPPLQVRIGLHTGTPSLHDSGDASQYLGSSVHTASRVASAAHGGQVLVSEQTYALVNRQLSRFRFHNHGEFHLKGIGPEPLIEVLWEGKQPTTPTVEKASSPPREKAPPQTSYHAEVKGSGAIAQGPGAAAAGEGGIVIGGSAQGDIHTDRGNRP
ncbi:MAG: adenylate/guanylate cyclase domain-containing protein [Armatimonadetes bacterium]|nr:adenylate/guanylate cyclase domain-containing protein [Armatimonadota bacterium]